MCKGKKWIIIGTSSVQRINYQQVVDSKRIKRVDKL